MAKKLGATCALVPCLLVLTACGQSDTAQAQAREIANPAEAVSSEQRDGTNLEELGQHLRLDPVMGPGLNALAVNFPDDYARLIAEARKGYRAQAPLEETFKSGEEIIREVLIRETANLTRAPDAYLVSYLHAVTDAYQATQTSHPELCASIGGGSASMPSRPDRETLAAFSRVTATMIEAAAVGKARPVIRNIGPITHEEIQLMDRALMGEGATQADFAMMNDPQLLAYGGPQAQCRIRVMTLRAMKSFPDEIAARFTALMLIQQNAR